MRKIIKDRNTIEQDFGYPLFCLNCGEEEHLHKFFSEMEYSLLRREYVLYYPMFVCRVCLKTNTLINELDCSMVSLNDEGYSFYIEKNISIFNGSHASRLNKSIIRPNLILFKKFKKIMNFL